MRPKRKTTAAGRRRADAARVGRAVAAALALSAALPAAADEAAWERLADLAFPREERVAFVERHLNRLLRAPAEQSGELWLTNGGAAVMRVYSPRLEERRIEDDRLVLRRPRRRHAGAEDPDAAIGNGIERRRMLDPERGAHLMLALILDVLSGDISELRQRFDSRFSPLDDSADHRGGWEIELVPRDPAFRRELVAVRLRGDGNRLAFLRMSRGTRNWREIRLLFPSPGREPAERP